MTSETRLAFKSLEARAKAEGGANPPDRIALRDHVVEVEIGAFQAERGTTQRVAFDAVVEVAGAADSSQDNVDSVLSYDTIADAIAAELAAQRLNLLETLAQRIAERILKEPQALRVFLRIQKLDRGPGALGVEIVRQRPAVQAPETGAGPAVRPMIVFLSDAAVGSANLPGWLDGLMNRPAILCVDAPPVKAPQSPIPAAQRRIDFLAIEQNAWVLAGRDARCVVVDSRTELEWGLRHGQLSVWAPSRLALDARDRLPARAPALVAWLARQFRATELVCVGCPVPEGWQGPARKLMPDASSLV